MSAERTHKRQYAMSPVEVRVARYLATKLGYRSGSRFNVAGAMRDELVGLISDAELAWLLDNPTFFNNPNANLAPEIPREFTGLKQPG